MGPVRRSAPVTAGVARDWARFGLLYVTDGVVGDERVLPRGWVNYSARVTPGSEDYGYGAGFLTNRGTGSAIEAELRVGMPGDSFMARGSQGQYLVVIPSAGSSSCDSAWPTHRGET